MNVVDSSGWLAYFAGTRNADEFAVPIEATETLVVPAITIYEVAKHVLLHRSEHDALETVAQMQRGRLADVDAPTALQAARLSAAHRLPMADSLILATARRFSATLWTQDANFDGLDGVRFLPA